MGIATETYPTAATRPDNGRRALVITLDQVEAAFYTGWKGELGTAAQDRKSMADLLTSAKFAVTELTNKNATRQGVADALKAHALESIAGDHIIVYFSGHGARLPDLNRDERDVHQPGIPRDGAWCLHDGFFVDDELMEALTLFKEGVRFVLISDSCFTGAIVGDASSDAQLRVNSLATDDLTSKLAPVDIGERVYEVQREFYDAILTRPPADPAAAKARGLVLSACERDELALIDAKKGGSLLTANLVTAWNDGQFKGTYGDLFEEVKKAVTTQSSLQHPVVTPFGNRERPLAGEAAFGTQSGGPRSRRSSGEDAQLPMAAQGLETTGFGDPPGH